MFERSPQRQCLMIREIFAAICEKIGFLLENLFKKENLYRQLVNKRLILFQGYF